MKKSSKYWLFGAICLFLINLFVFIFRNYVHESLVLWVVVLTPVGCLVLYPLARYLARDRMSASE